MRLRRLIPIFASSHQLIMPIIFNRKKKDTAGIASVASGKSKSYVTLSRRTVNPQTGLKIKRGSEITSSPTKKLIGFKSVSAPGKISAGPPSIRTTSRFHPADMASGTLQKRHTVPAHASMHNEHPAKVSLRMKAQGEGRTSYPHPQTGRAEISGVRTDTQKFSPGKVSISTKSIQVPVHASSPSLKISSPKASVGVRLKPRAVTLGGSSRSGGPATKQGIGFKNRAVTRVVRPDLR